MPARQVPRDLHEDARDLARQLMGTKAFLKSRNERKRVEMRFAHLKIHHGFERMRSAAFPALATSPSRRHRAESQDAHTQDPRAATRREACVGDVGCVGVRGGVHLDAAAYGVAAATIKGRIERYDD